ncbi:MAG: divergent PAP2 family protein [Spirochaetales bacterium]
MSSIPLPAGSLLVAVGVQVLCQLFKVVLYSFRDRRFSPHYFVSAGGMPSAHSAFVTALTTSVGIRSGIDSDLFAVSFVFAAIVAYDAYRLRGHVQEHARRINALQARLQAPAANPRGEGSERARGSRGAPAGPDAGEPVSEMVGHSLPEIAAGVVFGIAGAVLVTLILS